MAIRFFNWKEKHKRKKRSCKPNGHGTLFYPAPSDFCNLYNRRDRSKSNLLVGMFEGGYIDEEMLELKLPRRHKHCASWDYW